MKNRNPIAKVLRSPALRQRVVSDKKKWSDRKKVRNSLKLGKYDRDRYDLPLLLRPMTFRRRLIRGLIFHAQFRHRSRARRHGHR